MVLKELKETKQLGDFTRAVKDKKIFQTKFFTHMTRQSTTCAHSVCQKLYASSFEYGNECVCMWMDGLVGTTVCPLFA